jgi:circadian clock protein KaiC
LIKQRKDKFMSVGLKRERVSFNSPELDAMLGGGFLKGSVALISGAPGVGKTTLGLQFLMAGLQAGQTGMLVSFEQFPASLTRDALQLGWDLKALEKDGRFRLVFTSPEVFLESLKSQQGAIAEMIQALAPERLVVDSAAHYQRLSRNALELRDIYNTLVNALKRQEVTSLFLDEAANVLQVQRGRVSSLPFLVDTVVLLRYVEVSSTMQRAIAVMKMRGSSHQKEIRRFEIQKGGLKVGEPFTNRAGILSGLPQTIA